MFRPAYHICCLVIVCAFISVHNIYPVYKLKCKLAPGYSFAYMTSSDKTEEVMGATRGLPICCIIYIISAAALVKCACKIVHFQFIYFPFFRLYSESASDTTSDTASDANSAWK